MFLISFPIRHVLVMGTMIKSHVVPGERVHEDIDNMVEDGNKTRRELQFDMYQIDWEQSSNATIIEGKYFIFINKSYH